MNGQTKQFFRRKVNGHHPKMIPTFSIDQVAYCGENLGPNEPQNYPAKYILDDHFPVVNIETNVTTSE
jgi:hypothetical protein